MLVLAVLVLKSTKATKQARPGMSTLFIDYLINNFKDFKNAPSRTLDSVRKSVQHNFSVVDCFNTP